MKGSALHSFAFLKIHVAYVDEQGMSDVECDAIEEAMHTFAQAAGLPEAHVHKVLRQTLSWYREAAVDDETARRTFLECARSLQRAFARAPPVLEFLARSLDEVADADRQRHPNEEAAVASVRRLWSSPSTE